MEKTTPHGTRAGYASGCRCEGCRTAWADYLRKWRHAAGLSVPRETHLIAKEIEQAEQHLAESLDDDTDATLNVALPPLALQILVQLQRERHQRRSEIVDELLRDFGPTLLDDASA